MATSYEYQKKMLNTFYEVFNLSLNDSCMVVSNINDPVRPEIHIKSKDGKHTFFVIYYYNEEYVVIPYRIMHSYIPLEYDFGKEKMFKSENSLTIAALIKKSLNNRDITHMVSEKQKQQIGDKELMSKYRVKTITQKDCYGENCTEITITVKTTMGKGCDSSYIGGIEELRSAIENIGRTDAVDYSKTYVLAARGNGKTKFVQEAINAYNKKWDIERVIFNEPATIVFWGDGSKTVVKCRKGDKFNKETGLALAICKHIAGDKYHYFDKFKHFIPELKEKKSKNGGKKK